MTQNNTAANQNMPSAEDLELQKALALSMQATGMEDVYIADNYNNQNRTNIVAPKMIKEVGFDNSQPKNVSFSNNNTPFVVTLKKI